MFFSPFPKGDVKWPKIKKVATGRRQEPGQRVVWREMEERKRASRSMIVSLFFLPVCGEGGGVSTLASCHCFARLAVALFFFTASHRRTSTGYHVKT